VPTAEDSSHSGERSHQPVASTLTFQLLKIGNPSPFVKTIETEI